VQKHYQDLDRGVDRGGAAEQNKNNQHRGNWSLVFRSGLFFPPFPLYILCLQLPILFIL
jgi:hypothetical protein